MSMLVLSIRVAVRGIRLASTLLSVLLLLLTLPAWGTPDTFVQVKTSYIPSEAWLLDRNGTVLAERRIDSKVRRLEWVALSDISPALQKTLILSEDRNFYQHQGVDWPALASSAWFNFWHINEDRHPRGASTLTMQLAGFLDPALRPKGKRRTLEQKWDQAMYAREMEQTWTKPEILEAYLNLASFRGEIVGINAISHALFGKHPAALDRAESLLLVALLQGPSARSNVVAKRACNIPAVFEDGEMPTCIQLQALAYEHLSSPSYNITQINLAPQLAQRLLLQAGSKVTTTLESELQRFVIQSLQEHLRELDGQEVQDGSVIVLDNASGEVLAYVASNRDTSEAPEVDGIQGLRQPGSTLKPFLYGMAIERRQLTAASILDDTPMQLSTPSGLYIPQNYDKDFKGPVTVRTALASSLNVPAVRTLSIVGVDRFVQRLRSFGLDSLTRDGDFYGFGLALGGADVRLSQLTNAYRALANRGVWRPISYLPSTRALSSRRVMSEQAAFIIADMLSDNAARATTFGLDNPLATRVWTAVKTGTSKDMRDNWCIGFSDRYTVGVWVGNFSGVSMRDVSGVSGAAPVWRDVINHLHHNVYQPKRSGNIGRNIPHGVVKQSIHYEPEVAQDRQEWFIEGTEAAVIRLGAYDDKEQGGISSILYPNEGTVIALDPDIPMQQQQLQFSARSQDEVVWRLDQRDIAIGNEVWWSPSSGHHELVLHDKLGKELSRVSFEVRGSIDDSYAQ